jgi:parallel beta-helix repeat protein
MFLCILAVGVLVPTFKPQQIKGYGPVYIRADGSIEPSDVPVSTLDNVTYTFADDVYYYLVIERNNIVVDGAGHMLHGAWGDTGISLNGRINVTIRNTRIKAFNDGISLDSCLNSTISRINLTEISDSAIYLHNSSGCMISENNATAKFIGMDLSNCSGILISENEIFEGGCGVDIFTSSNNYISRNNVTASGGGICLLDSSNNTVHANNLMDNEFCGLSIDESCGNTILENALVNNGLLVNHNSYLNHVENNMVNGRPLAYLENMSDYRIDDAGQVVLIRCERIIVEGLNLSKVNTGAILIETNNSVISHNYIADNNNYGINLDHSNRNIISANNVLSCPNATGIFLSFSSNNTLLTNNISNNGVGLLIASSSGNNISENNIANNKDSGISLFFCSNNTIFHNNFLNNNVTQAYVHHSTDYWDNGYPSGGNYWSNYNGTDSNCDGIGDSNYTIDASNIDHYPLMNAYTIPEFASFLVPFLLIVATFFVTILYKKKHDSKQ